MKTVISTVDCTEITERLNKIKAEIKSLNEYIKKGEWIKTEKKK